MDKKIMLSVTKKFSFCYGHRLPGYSGKCRNYHGHNSNVEVEIVRTGPMTNIILKDDYPGMVMDFSELKQLVEPVIEQLDHKDLNEVLDERFLPPTAEHIALYMWRQIVLRLPVTYRLVRLRVSETDDSFAELKIFREGGKDEG